ncbi:MAG: restriction endonuclease [Chloroflexi bacterium GWB2_49_20]|nr:MAG: restriction endonuclease [Chloroflexi bacterium GWB2_49_20]OGN77246.1 MAG: restriction endonuclease [Chloroflexi bacterium GWC2_49_37]OGN84757.1 MAG: restriction endonuclease [Chloroflexi bacterium GWD2_49_16]
MIETDHINEALRLLADLGLPKGQHNERSALCLLALLNLTPDKDWSQAENPLLGITPIMDWSSQYYQKRYAPNSRETFRRFTMHQFVQAGLVLYNPDKLDRSTNSPKAVYQIESTTLELIRTFGSSTWTDNLASYLSNSQTLSENYARERKQIKIPVQIKDNTTVYLSPGNHSELIRKIIDEFAPRFAPGSQLIYVGDTGDKWGYFDKELLIRLGVNVDAHGKMPDVLFYFSEKNWLLLVEAVTSHGPVDAKRHNELSALFANSLAGLVYVTAFPTRSVLGRYLTEIAWETEVWSADSPSHLIHFNGKRFLGPY